MIQRSALLPDNLGYLFDVPLRLTPDAPALLQGDRVLTFAQLHNRCNQAGSALLRLGVQPGDRVAMLWQNDIGFLESLFGAARIGAVPVPLNLKQTDEALQYVIADSEAKVLIAGGPLAARAESIARSATRPLHIVVDSAEIPHGAFSYESLLENEAPDLSRRSTHPDEICMQPYTSGSTGRPKGVLLTHAGQIWNADAMRKSMMLDDTERALVAVPLFHKNAMLGAIKPFLLAGGSAVILPGFDAKEVIYAIERYRITYLTGVPAMYKMILAERELLGAHDVSSIRYAKCGSAEVPQELLDDFARVFKAPIDESYGLTEGGPVPIVNVRWGLKKRGSCGREMPGCEVRLVAEDGLTEVPVNEPGELITRNPGLAKGYWKLPEVTAEKFRGGWLYTGDLLRRDEDGYYYFLGRRDDVINVAGEKVHPKEVEDILLRHPGVRDACVVPVRHDVKGFVPVAFVTKRPGSRTTEEEIKSFFLSQGAPYAHPRRVFFLGMLPLNGAGKLDRTAMRAMAEKAA